LIKVSDGGDDLVLLGVGQLGEDREGEDFPAGLFGDGKVAGLVAEVGEGFLQVETERVIDFARDAGLCEQFPQFVAALSTNRELIVDVMEFRRRNWRGGYEFVEATFGEELAIAGSTIGAACGPFLEVREFDAEDGGLERVEPAIGADDFVIVALLAAVAAQHIQALG